MKRLSCTVFFSILLIALFAQNPSKPGYKPQTMFKPIENSDAVVEEKIQRIDILGYHFEKYYSKQNTLGFGINVDFIYPYYDERILIHAGIMPKIELMYRHYYSLEKRKRLNRPYKKNTGPYISGKIEAQYIHLLTTDFNGFNAATGIVWGFQNNDTPLAINFEIGPGLGLINSGDTTTFALVILTKLEFGFLLNK